MMNREGEVEGFAEQLRGGHPEWTVRPIRKVSSNEGEVLVKIQGLMGLVSIVILLLSTLCVNTSLTAIVSERQREFALQKALGAADGAIIRQVLLETLAIAVAATVAGCLLGFVLAQVLGQTVFSWGRPSFRRASACAPGSCRSRSRCRCRWPWPPRRCRCGASCTSSPPRR